MKIKLTDQLHVSEVSSDTLPAGTEITVSDATGNSLVDRGLATKVGAKAAATPRNKAAPASRNKIVGARRSK